MNSHAARSQSRPLILIIAGLFLTWWAGELWQLATVKWMFLEHDDVMPAHKRLQLAIAGALAFIAVATSIAATYWGFSIWLVVVAIGIYLWLFCLRWV